MTYRAPLPTQLLTCRYWAFGSECPDLDRCVFAHRDTGQLASHFQQAGTCAYWQAGLCNQGSRCFYEHRHTGVPGLYQGRVELKGIDLEVADAAARSGFDTHNHVALFDLIWSVKRIAFRGPRVGSVHERPTPPPPAHPVYPDRYRPSGVGDNTRKKRSRVDDARTISIYRPPPPASSSKKGRGRNMKARNHHEKRITTNDLAVARPSHVLDYGDDNNNNNYDQQDNDQRHTLKRQKTNHMGKYTISGRLVIRDRSTSIITTTNDTTTTTTTNNDETPTAKIVNTMNGVKAELGKIQDCMAGWQARMKEMFDNNATILNDDVMMPWLTALSQSIFKIHDEAASGALHVDGTIGQLNNSRGNSFIIM